MGVDGGVVQLAVVVGVDAGLERGGVVVIGHHAVAVDGDIVDIEELAVVVRAAGRDADAGAVVVLGIEVQRAGALDLKKAVGRALDDVGRRAHAVVVDIAVAGDDYGGIAAELYRRAVGARGAVAVEAEQGLAVAAGGLVGPALRRIGYRRSDVGEIQQLGAGRARLKRSFGERGQRRQREQHCDQKCSQPFHDKYLRGFILIIFQTAAKSRFE